MYDKFKTFIIFFVLAVIILKTAMNAGFFNANGYRGNGFEIDIPEGWERNKRLPESFRNLKDTEVVQLVTTALDPKSQEPEAVLTIFVRKLEQALWIEDEFPNLLKSIVDARFKIADRGELKIDNQLAKWVLFYDKKVTFLSLDFYMITDNSTFYQLRYKASEANFNKHRSGFEKIKDSFKFSFSLF